MARRKQVGLLYSYDEQWIAGAYYISNIIHALDTLSDEDKPELTILSDSLETYHKLVEETRYPYLRFFEYPVKEKQLSFVKKGLNKIFRIFINKNAFVWKPLYPKLDLLYPRQLKGISENLIKVNWIPDFQEDYLPQFFSEEEVVERKIYQKNIVAKGDIVVFSSEDAKRDFIRLYPKAHAKPFVLNFAVTLADFSDQKLPELLVKYNLDRDYFFLPNQFWAHKNHLVVLQAVKILRDKGVNILVAMSGNESDYRNVDNFEMLKQYVHTNGLDAHIKFLGFLPRKEQLCLFKHAFAIIQPSLFEGWSTVVEDAKALNKFVILSDLKVHREQITDNVCFFEPHSSVVLAAQLETYLVNKPVITATNYENDVQTFAYKFVELVNLAIGNKNLS